MCRLSRLLLLGIWWVGQAVHAQPVFHIPPDRASVALSQELEYFIDESGRWRPDTGEPAPGTWLALRDRAAEANFGHNKTPIWLRLKLQRAPAAAVDWQWVVANPQIEWIDLWIQEQGGPLRHVSAGLGPIEQGWARPQRRAALPLPLSENTPTTVWMRVHSNGLLQIPVELWRAVELQESEQRTLTALGAYFGLLAGLLIYNGFLAVKLRDRAYTQYIALGLAQGVFQLSNTGVGHLFVWTDHALSGFLIRSLSIACFAGLALTFTNSFLRLDQKLPVVSRVLRASAAAWALLLLAHIGIDTHTLVKTITVPLALWTVLLILYAGVAGWVKGSPAAGYFVLAWSGVVVAGIVRVLLNLGLLPPHPVTYDGILFASAAEMLLLSMALADRISTERRARSEAEAQRMREQADKEVAQRALREKSGFMAAVAHDLQQPIYAMSLATESLARLHPAVPAGAVLLQMRSALHSADDLLASLAMATQLDRAELRPEVGDFSVQDMLERIEDMFSPRAHQRQLRWRVLPSVAVVRSDPVLLERMVCNLVSNALRYTRHGGVLLSARRRGDHLLIQVWDTGPGIDHDEHEAVFLLHHRGRSALGHDQGLGLGLALVKRCGELLQIQVGLRSSMGRGSCFSLWVPLATAPAESA